ncbi:MAG: serine/threonine-protein kinase [Nannocystaceae bacterium]
MVRTTERDSSESAVGQDDDTRVVPPEPARPSVPQRLGRYVVVGELGEGGMGLVLRGYDSKLRREVALKLLRTTPGASGGAAQIIREARAMARISHPNLVSIYDVEQDGDDAFIAMEFVEGETLHAWLRREPRPWSRVLELFLGAGQGLAAAHAAGVIHRDFKPTNVLVGTDERARVTDFGIAHDLAELDHDARVTDDAAVAPGHSVTAVGTPPYMAPEQHAGGEVGAAADQYAFCVALYEALYGVRPFVGVDLRALEQAKRTQPPRAPVEAASATPAWLRLAVVRGLAPAAGDRWPSMEALLHALARGQARARARRLWLAAGAVATIGIGVAVVQRVDVQRRTAACEAAGASIASSWNDDARARLHTALVAGGQRYAIETARRVMPWLDAHAEGWQAARTEACLAGEIRRTADAATTERALWCLDGQRMLFDALVEALSDADGEMVPRALPAVASLVGAEACADPARLLRVSPPPPPAEREAVAGLQAELSRVDALQRAGRFARGLELVGSIRERADAVAWAPLVAAVREREGQLQDQSGAYEQAERTATDAYFAAARAGAWDVAARAATRLMMIVGDHLARPDESLLWARHGEIALEQTGDAEGQGETERQAALAAVYTRKGDYVAALAAAERALELARASLGEEHPFVAGRLIAVATARLAAGEAVPARELLERALALQTETLGPDHPDLALTLSSLAQASYLGGDFGGAKAPCERALGLLEAALGRDHPRVAAALNNLALVLRSNGDNLGARAAQERAHAIWERALEPDHPDLAMSRANLALVYAADGELERADQVYAEVSASLERTLGPQHPEFAQSLVHRAQNLVQLKRPQEALPLLERAKTIFDAHPGNQADELIGAMALARALVATDGDRARARALAERVRDERRTTDANDPAELASIEAWLAQLDAGG